jgi:hypothetical protein
MTCNALQEGAPAGGPWLTPAAQRKTAEVLLKANLDAIKATADGQLGPAYTATGLTAAAVSGLPPLESILPCTAERVDASDMAAVALPEAQQPGPPPNSPAPSGTGHGGGAAARVSSACAAAAGAHLQRMLQAGHYTKPDAIVR